MESKKDFSAENKARHVPRTIPATSPLRPVCTRFYVSPQLIQNKAMRAITGRPKCDHISSSYQDLGVSKIPDLCKVEIASLMHKPQESNFPISFDNKFTKPSHIHRYSTRSNQKLIYYITRFRTARLQKFFRYTEVKLWNNSEKNMKQLSFNKFQIEHKNGRIFLGFC